MPEAPRWREVTKVEEATAESLRTSRARSTTVDPSWFARFLRRALDHRLLWVPFALILVFYAAANFRAYGLRLADWDLLLLSGFATLIAGLLIVRAIPQRMHLTLKRLANRQVVNLEGLSVDALIEQLEDRGLRWAMITAPVTSLAVTAAFFGAFDRLSLVARIPLILVEAVGGYVAGLHLGRMASYGALGRFLKQKGCEIRVWPGHVDGAAGLKPLGGFYFFQAMVAAIPAMFLAAWWVLIPLKGDRYARWRSVFGGVAGGNYVGDPGIRRAVAVVSSRDGEGQDEFAAGGGSTFNGDSRSRRTRTWGGRRT